MEYDIKAAIPHREPFLLVDEVIESSREGIRARTTLRPDGELWSRVFRGHYPAFPLAPGVLLCEMLFQAAGIVVHEIIKDENIGGVPVIARIQGVKFKNMVLPGDTVELSAGVRDRKGTAFFFAGEIVNAGKTAVQADFAVAIAPMPAGGGRGS